MLPRSRGGTRGTVWAAHAGNVAPSFSHDLSRLIFAFAIFVVTCANTAGLIAEGPTAPASSMAVEQAGQV